MLLVLTDIFEGRRLQDCAARYAHRGDDQTSDIILRAYLDTNENFFLGCKKGFHLSPSKHYLEE